MEEKIELTAAETEVIGTLVGLLEGDGSLASKREAMAVLRARRDALSAAVDERMRVLNQHVFELEVMLGLRPPQPAKAPPAC